MKIPISIILVFTLAFAQSCRSKYEDCTQLDYDDCFTERPEAGLVRILLTINEENPEVHVECYFGDYEKGDFFWEDDFRKTSINEYLDVETDLSFIAFYKSGNDSIIAVDGGRVDVFSYQMCEYRCYDVRVLEIDLRID